MTSNPAPAAGAPNFFAQILPQIAPGFQPKPLTGATPLDPVAFSKASGKGLPFESVKGPTAPLKTLLGQ